MNLERTPTIYQMMTFPSFPSQEKRYYSLMVNHELKKINDDDFLSTNGTEVCELVGAYLLILWKVMITKENQGFSRDDGLGMFKNISEPKVEIKEKRYLKTMDYQSL